VTCKVAQTDLVFGVLSGLISRSCTQDYTSLCAVVESMIGSTLVNIQTH